MPRIQFSRLELDDIAKWLKKKGEDGMGLIDSADGKSLWRQISDRKKANAQKVKK